MKVLVIGSGGREHALAWKLAQSPRLTKLYIAPGNPGTALVGENIDIKETDVIGLVEFAKANQIDLTVVGPSEVLAVGVVDEFQAAGLKIFGPTRAAAQIESSKAFAKQFMQKYGIPTAKFQTFDDYEEATAYLASQSVPTVIKASGLAAGKGAIVCHARSEAEVALRQFMVEKVMGAAGAQVVIEECLEGQEVTIHALCDGRTSLVFPSSQDHKAIYDGDQGPNTGGMGAYAPVPGVSGSKLAEIKRSVVDPVLTNLPNFVGCLYPGLMGRDYKVIEYNARFGDPECQVYMRLLKSDLLDLFVACVEHRLNEYEVQWFDYSSVCIVLAEEGYPNDYEVGFDITGIEAAQQDSSVVIFQRNTGITDGRLVTAGGRVLNVTATAPTLQEAIDKAYAAAAKIHFKGIYYRTDIGAKGLMPDKA